MSTVSRSEFLPKTSDLLETFTDEIRLLGGHVPDVFEDGECLYARAVLPVSVEVQTGDVVHGGVAVRAMGSETFVHPYTFREVCTNGAITAHVLGSRRLERTERTAVLVPENVVAVATTDFRLAVRACAAREVFAAVSSQMRSALEVMADGGMSLLSIILRASPDLRQRAEIRKLMASIFIRFEEAKDDSVFGLMNAVTAVARDTRDPEIRWRLEELGGGMLARLRPPHRIAPAGSAIAASGADR